MDYKEIYRPAVVSDSIEFLSLVQEFCKENKIDFDNKAIKGYIDAQLGKIPVLVAQVNGEIVGVISFLVMPSPFNPSKIISKKIAFFVSSEYRGHGIGEKLLTKAEEQAKSLGATEFYVAGTEPMPGYSVFETEYKKEI